MTGSNILGPEDLFLGTKSILRTANRLGNWKAAVEAWKTLQVSTKEKVKRKQECLETNSVDEPL